MKDQPLQIPPICPYCHTRSRLVDDTFIYHEHHGEIYLCANYPECDTYVGVHRGTTQPKGTMANQLLRYQRRQAHAVFDPLIKRKQDRDNVSESAAKRAAYEWLAEALNISASECHIGWFDEERCLKTIELCSPYYKNPPQPSVK